MKLRHNLHIDSIWIGGYCCICIDAVQQFLAPKRHDS